MINGLKIYYSKKVNGSGLKPVSKKVNGSGLKPIKTASGLKPISKRRSYKKYGNGLKILQ